METNIALLALLVVASAASKGASSQKSLDAYVRYTGADTSINQSFNHVQQNVDKSTQMYLGAGVYLTKSIIDRRIEFTYRFP